MPPEETYNNTPSPRRRSQRRPRKGQHTRLVDEFGNSLMSSASAGLRDEFGNSLYSTGETPGVFRASETPQFFQ